MGRLDEQPNQLQIKIARRVGPCRNSGGQKSSERLIKKGNYNREGGEHQDGRYMATRLKLIQASLASIDQDSLLDVHSFDHHHDLYPILSIRAWRYCLSDHPIHPKQYS